MQDSEISFIDRIAQHCTDKYLTLPKTGKPVQGEWTVLSCVVKYNSTDDGSIEVVSLGTGSKCIGASKMSSSGDILNDSHAEVIARRGFLIYLYENINKAFLDQESIFTIVNGKCLLKESIQFAFYSSQLPCGDAAILPKEDSDLVGDILQPIILKRKAEADPDVYGSKCSKLENGAVDIHRTGAKCLEEAPQDPRAPGSSYHLLGQVRTKPGRGDRTRSVSCSDKMARWVHVGIQGALIDMLLAEPIFISRFVFGGGVPYCEASLRRALLERNHTRDDILPKKPSLHQSAVCFKHVRSDNILKPAAGSILWVNTSVPILEVAVLGIRLGATKKTKNAASRQLSISKLSLYKRFLQLVVSNSLLKTSVNNENKAEMEYDTVKRKSSRYYDTWAQVKKHFFGTWTSKGVAWNFTVDVE